MLFRPSHRSFLPVAVVALWATRALAEGPPHAPPPVTDFPSQLSLDDALRLLHERGLDLLIAEAQVVQAEGDVLAAGMVRNPGVSIGLGPTFNYSAHPAGQSCDGCSELSVNASATDSGAAFDSLVGKRGLRRQVAQAALAAARLSRDDAERQLVFQVKQAYVQVAVQLVELDFDLELQRKMTDTLALNRLRYPGVIDEGALSRVEVQKLEADQAVSSDYQTLRQARLALAFLLGARGAVPDFSVDRGVLGFRVPERVAASGEEQLLERAIVVRPDLKAFARNRERARQALRLARRGVMPDVALQAGFSAVGSGPAAASPPALALGVGLNLPIFYQQQGEVLRAQSDTRVQALGEAKALSQVASDVAGAWASYLSQRRLVERMNGGLLDRARVARDITERQFKAGALSLTDFLDAQRAFIAVNNEYYGDLAAYWTAVFLLEQAVGERLAS